jgi:hypothetical protein
MVNYIVSYEPTIEQDRKHQKFLGSNDQPRGLTTGALLTINFFHSNLTSGNLMSSVIWQEQSCEGIIPNNK